MINIDNTEPFFDSDDLDEPVMAATKVGHDHIIPLIRRKQHLVDSHRLLHALGFEDTPVHDLCLDQYHEVQSDLRKAWAAPWN